MEEEKQESKLKKEKESLLKRLNKTYHFLMSHDETQNPVEQEGTYPLPEAQMDRFMLKVLISYPTLEEEKKVMRENLAGELPKVMPVTTVQEIMKAREVVRQVYIDEKIEQYIADIVFATRYPDRYGLPQLKDMIMFGGSPRASINLAKAARAYAFIKRRGIEC